MLVARFDLASPSYFAPRHAHLGYSRPSLTLTLLVAHRERPRFRASHTHFAHRTSPASPLLLAPRSWLERAHLRLALEPATLRSRASSIYHYTTPQPAHLPRRSASLQPSLSFASCYARLRAARGLVRSSPSLWLARARAALALCSASSWPRNCVLGEWGPRTRHA